MAVSSDRYDFEDQPIRSAARSSSTNSVRNTGLLRCFLRVFHFVVIETDGKGLSVSESFSSHTKRRGQHLVLSASSLGSDRLLWELMRTNLRVWEGNSLC